MLADEFAAAAREDRPPSGETRARNWPLLAESYLTRRQIGTVLRRIGALHIPTSWRDGKATKLSVKEGSPQWRDVGEIPRNWSSTRSK